MKNINKLFLSMLLVTSGQNVFSNNISIEDQIHNVVKKHEQDLRTLNKKNFDTFKANLITVLNKDKAKYKLLIQTVESLTLTNIYKSKQL